jgi:His/Glu/Gln/Arg/opine family amino acid ABC transporter permease subunit
MTIALSALGLCLALIVGVVVGTAGSSARRALRRSAAAYVEVMRNVPLLVHMYFWYVGLAFLQLPPFACAVAALTLYSGAYVAETVRSGLGAVPRGQRLAALATGLTPRPSRGQTFRTFEVYITISLLYLARVTVVTYGLLLVPGARDQPVQGLSDA